MTGAASLHLRPGARYAFWLGEFQHPVTGEVLPGDIKTRVFIREVVRPAGSTKLTFLEVSRTDGSKHLIDIDQVRLVELAE